MVNPPSSKAGSISRAIVAKLDMNADLVEKAKSGRITWKVTSKGTVEIKLQPDL